MEKTYIISWTDRNTGRRGQGKKLLDKQDANALAAELNQEFPEYEHLVVNTADPQAKPLPPVLQPLAAATEQPHEEPALAQAQPILLPTHSEAQEVASPLPAKAA